MTHRRGNNPKVFVLSPCSQQVPIKKSRIRIFHGLIIRSSTPSFFRDPSLLNDAAPIPRSSKSSSRLSGTLPDAVDALAIGFALLPTAPRRAFSRRERCGDFAPAVLAVAHTSCAEHRPGAGAVSAGDCCKMSEAETPVPPVGSVTVRFSREVRPIDRRPRRASCLHPHRCRANPPSGRMRGRLSRTRAHPEGKRLHDVFP